MIVSHQEAHNDDHNNDDDDGIQLLITTMLTTMITAMVMEKVLLRKIFETLEYLSTQSVVKCFLLTHGHIGKPTPVTVQTKSPT